ncbi:UDP-N-acetylmuramoyl-L-alanyl-D-glutamate--2,6-diaminopimelate ligase [Hyphobacterium marinum]|uniref:UDP-N-acetylmuramoyl-L-alanyl-D-glutamate--2,6-diaminopimelate ligase n=1 Tax=Hyphobacterium marinum TaxID=3116574 RepID=A0ABU7LWY5_9PROT|nr:UDP-N-acetylmuramoyl-L-alanyl-D-glutamate--2,6-diaminopimelate ligase [Hyphobacterium sp. Y6023]MEE2566058.1 UDP-N-acetylmuramoyl-L-alanyl-D-glutamate--2,6-diaminopimelate ligase [Hyphobacterium sp. Y6023]
MKLAELVSPNAAPPGHEAVEIAGLTLDSRAVKPGFLFAALKGLTVDGRNFIPQAIANGAAAILTDSPVDDVSVPVVLDADPAGALSRLAARFYPRQPEFIAAVTGTNGKSSTVDFLRQIWRSGGIEAASLGTLGVAQGSSLVETGYTTPDAVALHQALNALAADGVTHLAMEASSHGLKQKRMDGARISLAAFTNLTQDHLDYHPDFDDYFASKMKLLRELTPKGSPAIVNVDSDWGGKVEAIARECGLDVITVGWAGADWRILEITPRAASQTVKLQVAGARHTVELPLVGEFQTANAVGAAAMAAKSGVSTEDAIEALRHLKGVAGRLELAVRTKDGSPVLVDYAHTPDGLDKLLRAARPHTRGRVIIVFGCGGDRDPTKRPKMGVIAAQLADRVFVTDDNPRSERGEDIRAAIMKGCPDAIEIGDRMEAIRAAVAELESGDTLLLAGKGHETGQKIGTKILPFDDREAARQAVAEQEGGA